MARSRSLTSSLSRAARISDNIDAIASGDPATGVSTGCVGAVVCGLVAVFAVMLAVGLAIRLLLFLVALALVAVTAGRGRGRGAVGDATEAQGRAVSAAAR